MGTKLGNLNDPADQKDAVTLEYLNVELGKIVAPTVYTGNISGSTPLDIYVGPLQFRFASNGGDTSLSVRALNGSVVADIMIKGIWGGSRYD
ncbi:hypothetical protein AGMMS50239_36650 [Bacteroidia bacterium]|nr:hypothetical protein AGMMS50239_36650 [Bacteroidia bacterium]